MAAVHTCFVPLARLSSLEVVSHSGRGRWRCHSALACLGEALSRCWRGPGSSMCWPVRGFEHSSVLHGACGVRLLCSPRSPSHVALWVTQLCNSFSEAVFTCFTAALLHIVVSTALVMISVRLVNSRTCCTASVRVLSTFISCMYSTVILLRLGQVHNMLQPRELFGNCERSFLNRTQTPAVSSGK